jgi:hypothetical protein
MTSYCPRRCGRPSRRVLVNTSGHPVLCRECFLTSRQRPAKVAKMLQPPRVRPSPLLDAKVDRIYRAALKALRPYRRQR